MWNFKALWNSTENILHIHWKIWYNVEILRAFDLRTHMHFLTPPPKKPMMINCEVDMDIYITGTWIKIQTFNKIYWNTLQTFNKIYWNTLYTMNDHVFSWPIESRNMRMWGNKRLMNYRWKMMMTSRHGKAFCIIGPLCWIPFTKGQ